MGEVRRPTSSASFSSLLRFFTAYFLSVYGGKEGRHSSQSAINALHFQQFKGQLAYGMP